LLLEETVPSSAKQRFAKSYALHRARDTNPPQKFNLSPA
jgi:hypothetical protein